jgi:hypothetical protein
MFSSITLESWKRIKAAGVIDDKLLVSTVMTNLWALFA